MDLQKLAEYGRHIEKLMEGKVAWELDRALELVVEKEDWELLGHLLLTASEVSAQRLVRKLLELEVYEPLVWAACLRRQPRRPGEGARRGGVARRIFRDWEAEEDSASIPEHIRADAEEISKQAEETRSAMMVQAAEVDRDPMRDYIVTHLAEKLATSEEALEALLVVVRASAWEETRRTAALKVANNTLAVSRLARELRSADLLAVAEASTLGAVAGNMATALGQYIDELKAAGDEKGLAFIAEHHPKAATKALAKQTLEG